MIWRRHRRTGPRHTPEQVAATWQVASVLLDYPDDRLVERLPLLRTAATALPGELGSGLDRHEHVGLGAIGEEGFRLLLHRPERVVYQRTANA